MNSWNSYHQSFTIPIYFQIPRCLDSRFLYLLCTCQPRNSIARLLDYHPKYTERSPSCLLLHTKLGNCPKVSKNRFQRWQTFPFNAWHWLMYFDGGAWMVAGGVSCRCLLIGSIGEYSTIFSWGGRAFSPQNIHPCWCSHLSSRPLKTVKLLNDGARMRTGFLLLQNKDIYPGSAELGVCAEAAVKCICHSLTDVPITAPAPAPAVRCDQWSQ